MKYLSIDKDCKAEIIIKKSRFIAYITPAENEINVMQVLEKVKKKWPQATHYCYAFILREPHTQRYSDDGEPSGTAGIPILQILKNYELQNVLAVVIRYFGGTLLGASGLVRAYSDAVKNVLNQAQIKEYALCSVYACTIDYNFWGNIEHNQIRTGAAQIKHIEFGSQVNLEILIPRDKENRILEQINTATNGSAELKHVGEGYYYIQQPKF